MRPERVGAGDQGDAVSDVEQCARQVETDGVAAQENGVAVLRQRIGDFDGVAECAEPMQQRPGR